MAKLVFGMNTSLDGYVDYDRFAPDPVLFQHFVEQAREQTAAIYGRGLYEIMRYWDEDDAGWGEAERAFADAWRAQHKWVVSRSLSEVGPNATLVGEDFAAVLGRVKAEQSGEIEVGGPVLARSLGELGLIDAYRMYLHPVVLGHGDPYFVGPRLRLRLVAHERIGPETIRLTYEPADAEG